MNEKMIYFTNVNDVLKFSSIADHCDFNIDIQYRHFMLDGKSIMALLQMDYSQPLIVRYNGFNPQFESVLSTLAIHDQYK